MEFYEAAEKILAGSGDSCVASAWLSDCDWRRFINSSVHLHLVLA